MIYESAEAPKAAYRNHQLLTQLHLTAAPRLAPNAVLYDKTRHWLFLIETVPAHGSITPARRQ